MCALALGTFYRTSAQGELSPHVRYQGEYYACLHDQPLDYGRLEERLLPAGVVDTLVEERAERDFQTNCEAYWGGGLYRDPSQADTLYLRLNANTPEETLLLLEKAA